MHYCIVTLVSNILYVSFSITLIKGIKAILPKLMGQTSDSVRFLYCRLFIF